MPELAGRGSRAAMSPPTFALQATLLEALDLRAGDLVAVAGAGGKSTFVQRLALEARAAGLPTLLAATTRLALTAARDVAVIEDGHDAQALVEAALARDGIAALAGPREGATSFRGVAPERVSALASRARLTLVETDGARGRGLKLPASHEPCVPTAATLLLVVSALDALGRPPAEEHVHRLELVRASLTRSGLDPLAALDARALAALLLDPSGYLARRPAGARVAVMLNERAAPPPDAVLAELAERLLAGYDVLACGATLGGPLRVARRAALLS